MSKMSEVMKDKLKFLSLLGPAATAFQLVLIFLPKQPSDEVLEIRKSTKKIRGDISQLAESFHKGTNLMTATMFKFESAEFEDKLMTLTEKMRQRGDPENVYRKTMGTDYINVFNTIVKLYSTYANTLFESYYDCGGGIGPQIHCYDEINQVLNDFEKRLVSYYYATLTRENALEAR